MNPEPIRRITLSSRNLKRLLLGNICLAIGVAMAMASSPAMAKTGFKHRRDRNESERANRNPFGDIAKGPLQIFVSIDQQKLHLYSDGRHVADVPVATGLPGHLTPLGIFNVIERDRHHHSNLYDDAPMPYMQRITWSGVALHEGAGVGHQASHGCIRMPGDFAARLWQLHTIGMSVIIADPELRPIAFEDPHLFVHTNKPVPAASLPHAVKTAQAIAPGTRTDAVEPVALGGAAKAASTSGQTSDPPPAGANTAGSVAATTSPLNSIVLAATPGAMRWPAFGLASTATSDLLAATEVSAAAPTLTADDNHASAVALAAGKPPMPAAAKPAKSSPTAIAATAPANSARAGASNSLLGESAAILPTNLIVPVNAPLQNIPLPPAKPTRLAESNADAPIAIFISRKTGKIYVRQNFTPVFAAPVSIRDPKEPLGTHLFTAEDYLPDHSALRWTVASMPGETTRLIEHWKYHRDDWGRRRRVRVEEAAIEPTPPPQTPQQALARIEIPQDVIDQISRMIVPGSSLLVSDQGFGQETGDGTDFIVVTH